MNELEDQLHDELAASAEAFAPATDFEAVLDRAHRARRDRTARRVVALVAAIAVAGAVGWSTSARWVLGGPAPILATPAPTATSSLSPRPSISPGAKESVTLKRADGLDSPVEKVAANIQYLFPLDRYQLDFTVTTDDGHTRTGGVQTSADGRAAIGQSDRLVVALIRGNADSVYWGDRLGGGSPQTDAALTVLTRYLPQVDATLVIATTDLKDAATRLGCVWRGTSGPPYACSGRPITTTRLTLSGGDSALLFRDEDSNLEGAFVDGMGSWWRSPSPGGQSSWGNLGSAEKALTMIILPPRASDPRLEFAVPGVESVTGRLGADRVVILAGGAAPDYVHSVVSQVTYTTADGREATWKAPG